MSMHIYAHAHTMLRPQGDAETSILFLHVFIFAVMNSNT